MNTTSSKLRVIVTLALISLIVMAGRLAWATDTQMFEGRIMTVDAQRIVLMTDGKEVNATIEDQTEVMLNGREVSPSDLRVGSKAVLVTKSYQGKMIAMSIIVDEMQVHPRINYGM